jgi:hypothetical protein
MNGLAGVVISKNKIIFSFSLLETHGPSSPPSFSSVSYQVPRTPSISLAPKHLNNTTKVLAFADEM